MANNISLKNFKANLTMNQRLEWQKKANQLKQFCLDKKIPYQTGAAFFLEIKEKKYLITNMNLLAMLKAKLIKDDVTVIRASKLRVIDIYNDILAGKTLDKFGNVIEDKQQNNEITKEK